MQPFTSQQSSPVVSPAAPIVEPTRGFWRRHLFVIITGVLGPVLMNYLIFIPGAVVLFVLPLSGFIIGILKFFFLWPVIVGLRFGQYWMVEASYFFSWASIPGLLVAMVIDIGVLIGISELYRRWSKRGVIIVALIVVVGYVVWGLRNTWIVFASRVSPSVCALGSEEYYRDDCFTKTALAREDYHLCTRVSYNPYQCLDPFITADRPDDFCRLFPPGSNPGDNCTIKLAGLKRSSAICDQIAGNAKDACLAAASGQ